MWEIVQGSIPYLPMSNQDVIEFVCVKKQTLPPPTRITNLPEEIYDCMKSCWNFQAGNRPTFDGLYETLSEVESTVTEVEQVKNDRTTQIEHEVKMQENAYTSANSSGSNYANAPSVVNSDQ